MVIEQLEHPFNAEILAHFFMFYISCNPRRINVIQIRNFMLS